MHRTQPSEQHPSPAIAWRSAGRFAVRYGSGAVMVLAGVLVLVTVPAEIGGSAIGWVVGAGLSLLLLKAGLALLALNLLARFSAGGERGREPEQAASGYRGQRNDRPAAGRRVQSISRAR